jgi:hypothetical protein
VTIFGVPWDDLALEHVKAFLDDADDEPYLWEAKGGGERLASRTVRKAVCGFANSRGGWLIVGADREEDRTWTLNGVDAKSGFGREEPRTWFDSVIRDGMSPVPDHDTKDWWIPTQKIVAVVRVEPIAEPPCITRDGIVWQRVSGRTIPVTDPLVLARLTLEGERARDAAQAKAERALEAFGIGDLPRTHCALLLGLSIAPVGTPRDISANLFTPQLEAKLKEIVGGLAVQPLFVDHDFADRTGMAQTRHRQDAIIASTPQDDRWQSWELRASWDGSVSVLLRAIPGRESQLVMVDDTFSEAIRPMADAVVEVAQAIGGYGRAHVVLRASARQFELFYDGKTRAIPGPGTFLPIQRWTDEVAIDDDLLASVKRELLRATGIAAYEAT